MKEITDEEYEEYSTLKNYYGMNAIQESIQSLSNVKDDIDTPLRKTIAGLALLGCEPMWSCCGYDYPGQLIHKRHLYGKLYICCRDNKRTNMYLPSLPGIGGDPYYGWVISKEKRDSVSIVSLYFNWGGDWVWNKEDFHLYGEIGEIRIHYLEEAVELFKPHFMESSVVEDSNRSYHNRYSQWLYPELGDWNVTKQEYESL